MFTFNSTETICTYHTNVHVKRYKISFYFVLLYEEFSNDINVIIKMLFKKIILIRLIFLNRYTNEICVTNI